jgi:radical SAM superfamily enzyme YgiQ (UPF0313 family)
LDALDALNRKTSGEETRSAFRVIRKAGIETVAFIILLPGIDRSENDMAKRMVRMVTDLKADALQCNIAIPYPGSKMYAAYKEKYEMPDDWTVYDPAGSGVPYPTDIDLVKVRRNIYLRFFFSNPPYLWKTFTRTDLRSIFTFAVNSMKVLLKTDY